MKIHSKNCVEPLIQCLDDINYNVQITAAESLGEFKSKRAALSLIEKLQDDSRKQSKKGEKIDSEKLRRLEILYNNVEELNETPSPGKYLIPDKVSFGLLMENSEKGNHLLRRACAESLGRMKNKRAIRPLIKALDDPYSEVGEAAAQALETMRVH